MVAGCHGNATLCGRTAIRNSHWQSKWWTDLKGNVIMTGCWGLKKFLNHWYIIWITYVKFYFQDLIFSSKQAEWIISTRGGVSLRSHFEPKRFFHSVMLGWKWWSSSVIFSVQGVKSSTGSSKQLMAVGRDPPRYLHTVHKGSGIAMATSAPFICCCIKLSWLVLIDFNCTVRETMLQCCCLDYSKLWFIHDFNSMFCLTLDSTNMILNQASYSFKNSAIFVILTLNQMTSCYVRRLQRIDTQVCSSVWLSAIFS